MYESFFLQISYKHPLPGRVEIDPHELWQAFTQAISLSLHCMSLIIKVIHVDFIH